MLSSRKYYHRILQSNVKLQFLLMVGENYVRSKTIIREYRGNVYWRLCRRACATFIRSVPLPLFSPGNCILIDLIRHVRITCAIQIIIYKRRKLYPPRYYINGFSSITKCATAAVLMIMGFNGNFPHAIWPTLLA